MHYHGFICLSFRVVFCLTEKFKHFTSPSRPWQVWFIHNQSTVPSRKRLTFKPSTKKKKRKTKEKLKNKYSSTETSSNQQREKKELKTNWKAFLAAFHHHFNHWLLLSNLESWSSSVEFIFPFFLCCQPSLHIPWVIVRERSEMDEGKRKSFTHKKKPLTEKKEHPPMLLCCVRWRQFISRIRNKKTAENVFRVSKPTTQPTHQLSLIPHSPKQQPFTKLASVEENSIIRKLSVCYNSQRA